MLCVVKNNLIILALLLLSTTAWAQRGIIVVDLDTYKPVQGVSITDNFNNTVTTDKHGIVMLPAGVDSLTFSHVLYAKEKLSITEVADTMFLLPNDHHLPEVTAWAPNPELSRAMMKSIYEDMNLIVPSGGLITFDLARILDQRARRDAKHLERAQEILEEWDKKKE